MTLFLNKKLPKLIERNTVPEEGSETVLITCIIRRAEFWSVYFAVQEFGVHISELGGERWLRGISLGGWDEYSTEGSFSITDRV